jgi:hypothetical protein
MLLVKGAEGTFAAASTFEIPDSWPHGQAPTAATLKDAVSDESAAARNAGALVKGPFIQLESVPTISLLPSA